MNRGLKRAFTMIELIFVIIILGILAVTALPKFIGIQDDAKIATENGTIGAVRGAVSISHGKWLIKRGIRNDWDNDGFEEYFSDNGYLLNLETGNTYDSSVENDDVIFAEILSEPADGWRRLAGVADSNISEYEGASSHADNGVANEGTNDINKTGQWNYNSSTGSFAYGSNNP